MRRISSESYRQKSANIVSELESNGLRIEKDVVAAISPTERNLKKITLKIGQNTDKEIMQISENSLGTFKSGRNSITANKIRQKRKRGYMSPIIG